MKAIDAIKQIKVMLGMEPEVTIDSETSAQPAKTKVELAEATLIDGTIVKAESLTEGAAIFVVTEEGDIPAPVGVHETTDGMLVTVEEEGIIAKVEEKPMDEPEVEEAKEEFNSEDFLGKIAELINSKFSELEAKINTVNTEFHAFKSEPGARKITNNLGETQKVEGDLATARLEKLMEFRNQTKK